MPGSPGAAVNARKTLSPSTQRALDRLTAAAKTWGVQQEWGNGRAVDNAEAEYTEALTAMRARLLRMEKRIQLLAGVPPNE